MRKTAIACLVLITVANIYGVFRPSASWKMEALNAAIFLVIGLGWGMLLGAFLGRIDREKSRVAEAEKEFCAKMERTISSRRASDGDPS